MQAPLDRMFIDFSSKKLEQLLARIRDCASKLKSDEIWARGHENENAIGNLMLHLNGNVKQWIVSGIGGAPDTRTRDAEFSARGGMAGPELLEPVGRAILAALTTLLDRK